MTFSERLKILRKERNLSQKKLAELADLSQTAIYYWEKGERNPKVEQLQKVAVVLEVPIWDLLGITRQDAVLMYESDYYNKTPYDTASISRAIKKDVIYEKNFKKLRNAYDLLNVSGQEEAVKRVEELSEIKKYAKEKK